ncbi:hypothetical protein JIN85_15190 [Luteolibacter pohnpeiensis]|uniref:CobW/HypB/UreG nucleotide-binding domain-containing protein n=1 Tax=Luteolibacter pohnpeiensis TaxID=454153 RepID=A0A934VVP1_9BACT|nr:GTP-binding protein [Luteolibacter pohnpeiensis]MBK1883762.1 hypothetical protein [Luteolibacter pohnpeiensis]
MLLEPLPELVSMRPMVLISGFLGAGKTTFLRDLLQQLVPHQLTADVILNDYENANLDAETLQEKAATIAPLASSCACCSGLKDLVDLAVAAQTTRSDVLLVELNGTADPIPLLESFTLLERKLRFRPRWQIGVIDARHFGNRGYYDELEVQQLQTASHFLLSHLDSVPKSKRKELFTQIQKLNPYASRTIASRLAANLAGVIATSSPVVVSKTEEHPSAHAHHQHGHHLSHTFTGCQILLPPRLRLKQVTSWLASLPESVIRAKALVTLIEEPGCRKLFERVGLDTMPKPLEVPISDRVPTSAICIGPQLDPNELLEHARQHFGPSVKIPEDE